MSKHEHLTNERLRNMFENQFELVNYAIKLAEHFISSGKEPFANQNNQNLASKILRLIVSGKDRYREVQNEQTFIDQIERILATDETEIVDTRIKIEEENEDDDESEENSSTQTVEAI